MKRKQPAKSKKNAAPVAKKGTKPAQQALKKPDGAAQSDGHRPNTPLDDGSILLFGMTEPIGVYNAALSKINLFRMRQKLQYAKRQRAILYAKLKYGVIPNDSNQTLPADPYIQYFGCSISQFPLFQEAEDSALTALEQLRARNKTSLHYRSWRSTLSSFFGSVAKGASPATLGKLLIILTESAVRLNDADFFSELARDYASKTAVARSKQASPKLDVARLNLFLVAYWTEKLLWLATDFAAALYFKHELGFSNLTESAYTKCRQRLKLKPHPKLQPISGYSPKTGFVFRQGDLDTFVTRLSI